MKVDVPSPEKKQSQRFDPCTKISTNLAWPFEHVVPADVEAPVGLGVLQTLAGHGGGVAGLANPQGPVG